MRAILALAIKTVHSAVRSKVVHVLVFFSLLTVFVMPLTLVSDGTAKGLVQVSLTYTLGITGVLLSVAAVWLGTTLMSEDIEGYQIHMVVTKPVSRAGIWFGKWLGIVVMLGAILIFDAAVIYTMCRFRLHRSSFPEAEMTQLNTEVLVGRRLFRPEMIDLKKWAEREFRRQLAAGREVPKGMSEGMAIEQIRNQISRGEGNIAYKQRLPFVFKNVPDVEGDGPIYLRYRLFVSDPTNMDQRETRGVWIFENPRPREAREMNIGRPVRSMGGAFQEVAFSRALVSDAHEVRLAYINLDSKQEDVAMQRADGPMLMVEAVSFLNNYFRVVALILAQIIFMATLGCATGAVLSSPVAVFLSFSYVMMGILVRYMRPMEGEVQKLSSNPLLIMTDYIAAGVKSATFSLNDFVKIDLLSDGRLIETSELLATLGTVLGFRVLPVVIIGILCFKRRELGLVIRK